MSSSISLSSLPKGKDAIVLSLPSDGLCASRLIELGFFPGAKIRPLFTAISGDPCAYSVQRAVIALRKDESDRITVYPI